MIDFVKLSKRVSDEEYKQILKNIDCDISIIEQTGEVISRLANGKKVRQHKECWHKNIKIKLYPNKYTEISGSLHKYYNDGKHNYNQYSIKNVKETMSLISNKIGVNISDFKVDAVEIGCNISPPIKSREIIQNTLMYKRNAFESKFCSDEGNYKQAKLYEYTVKLYDKRKHYEVQKFKIGKEIFRFEIKVNKMRKLSSFSIFSLNDLVDNLDKVKDILPELWDNILLYDPTVSNKIMKETIHYANVNYWINLVKKKNRSYHYHQNKYRRIIEQKHSSIKLELKKIMVDTLDALV